MLLVVVGLPAGVPTHAPCLPVQVLYGGGHGVQPDFTADLAAALQGHILPKFLTYTVYAKQYQQASVAARASGRTFRVCTTSAGRQTLSYQGSGDLFDWMNYDTPMLRYSSSTGGGGCMRTASTGKPALRACMVALLTKLD